MIIKGRSMNEMLSMWVHMKEDTILNHLHKVSWQLVNWLDNYSHLNLTIQTLTFRKALKRSKGQITDPLDGQMSKGGVQKIQYNQIKLHAKFQMNRSYGFILKGVLTTPSPSPPSPPPPPLPEKVTPIVSHLLRRRDKNCSFVSVSVSLR